MQQLHGIKVGSVDEMLKEMSANPNKFIELETKQVFREMEAATTGEFLDNMGDSRVDVVHFD